MRLFNSIIASLLLCSSAFAIDFTIGKGDHYSTPLMKKMFRKSKMEFKATFNNTAIYDLNNTEDQQDTNKLFGFSDCGGSHMENSARFGWRWWNNRLEIMAFTHKNGQFYYKYMASADLNRSYKYSIEISQNKYIFNFNDTQVEMDRGCTDESAKGYLLQPYFGGNQSAPERVTIKIDFNDQYASFSFGPVYPNPSRDGNVFLNMYVDEDLEIGVYVYDMLGRLVYEIPTQSYSAGQEYERVPLQITADLASGVYLIYPYALVNGDVTPGAYSGKGDASKLVIIK